MDVRCRVIAVLVLVAAVTFLAVAPFGESDAPAVDQDLVDEYGYADYIISEGSRSMVQITYRSYQDGSSDYEWRARTVAQGSSLNVADLTSLSGSLTVVMVGGTLGNLTLIQTDEIDDSEPVDVTFQMYGGEVSDMKVLTVPASLDSQVVNSYTLMFGPLSDIVLDLSSGHIGDLIPTEDMVSADSMSITIGSGMTIDRMLASGSNGRYGSVEVVLEGGSVGYMTNERSVVGSLSYDLRFGSVDYFCIGADTENGSNTYLSNLNTFYVQGDTHVHVDTSVEIRQAILGAGILDIPSVLWNGDSPQGSLARNVEIDAPSMTFSPDTCFLTSNRTQGNVYQFSTYTVGGTPRTKSMSTDYYVTGSSVRSPVYGEDGIWDSATDVTVGVTQYLYVYAEMTVSSGSTLTVENGGRLINSGNIYLVGTLQNDGEVVNHGIIEKREGGNISGNEPSGEGYVAYCINVSPTDGRIDVMASDDDTVVLRTDSTVYISRISVLLENGDREVTITVPETLYVGGDEFVISLRQVGGDDGIGTYDLNIIGIDPEVLGSLRVEVTVSCGLSTDTTCYVYLHDEVANITESMEVVDRSYGEVTFIATGVGTYFLSTISPEGIDELAGGFDENILNITLATIIVLVGASVVYILLKRD